MNISLNGILSVFFLFFAIAGCSESETETAEPSPKEIFYVGTFEGRGSEGLYVFEFDRNEESFRHIQTVSGRQGPNFQAVHPGGEYLYSVSDDPVDPEQGESTISAYKIDRETGELTLINEQPVDGSGICHVSADPLGKFVYVANYGSGSLSSFIVSDDGSLSGAADRVQHEGSSVNEQRQRAPHAHSTIPSPDGRFIYASDLGIDKIMIYEVDRETGELNPAETPWFDVEPGAGPRHFTFHPDGNYAYSVEELTSTVTALSVDDATGALMEVERVDMLPDDFEEDSWAADIHISPDGRFLYASNRGHDSLVIFEIDPATGRLNLTGHESTRGGHPRNFGIDAGGEYVFVANRDDDHVVLFKRDTETGMLSFTGEEMEVPMAVCVTQLILE